MSVRNIANKPPPIQEENLIVQSTQLEQHKIIITQQTNLDNIINETKKLQTNIKNIVATKPQTSRPWLIQININIKITENNTNPNTY